VNLAGFPRKTLRGDRTVHRIHRAVNGPWWFSSSGEGRFDPVGTGHGACYLADDALGAWVEVFRLQMVWAESVVAQRRLLSVELGRDLKLADLSSSRALRFGVTATLAAGTDRDVSQAFAAEAIEAGYDGVRYWVRHDPTQNRPGYAIFDAAGESANWPAAPSVPLSQEPVAEASRTYGYKILPRP